MISHRRIMAELDALQAEVDAPKAPTSRNRRRTQRRIVSRLTIGMIPVKGLAFVLLALFCGCSKEVFTEGEIFYTHGTNVIRKAGVTIYLLNGLQNQTLNELVEKRRGEIEGDLDRKFQEFTNRVRLGISRDRLAQDMRTTNALLTLYREKIPDDKRPDGDILLELGEKYDLSKWPDAAKDWIRLNMQIETAFAPNPADPNFPTIRSFLDTVQNVTSASDARFKVKLKMNQLYHVVADGAWHFQFRAQGQALILSDGNRVKRD